MDRTRRSPSLMVRIIVMIIIVRLLIFVGLVLIMVGLVILVRFNTEVPAFGALLHPSSTGHAVEDVNSADTRGRHSA